MTTYMLKISGRLSRFLTEWSFGAKVFPARGSKMSCHIIRTVQDFSNKNYFVFILNANKRISSTMAKKTGKVSRNSGRSSRNR